MRPTNANDQTKTLRNNCDISSSSSASSLTSSSLCWTLKLLFVSLSLLSCLPTTTWALSDKRLCADEKCEQIISLGSTKINYASGEAGMISFKIHAPVRVLSKSAGSNPKLWGVEINGRRGYANKDFIMEKKIIISEKDLKFELPVAGKLSAPVANNPEQAEQQKRVEQLQPPVLNASEGADDVATTTTSPLDTLKLSLLTEQTDQTSSNEAAAAAATPITPVQPKLKVVDGTELPLEAIANLKQAVKSAEMPPTTTMASDEEFDYEEDDSEDVYENDDNDADATLDSKDSEIPFERQVDNKVAAVEVEASILSSQATAAEQQNNLTLEAEAKQAAAVETLTPVAASTEAAAAAPSVEQQAEAPKAAATEAIELPKDEQNIVKPVEEPLKDLPVVEQPKEQSEQLPAVNEIKDQQPKEPAQEVPAVKEEQDQQPKEIFAAQPPLEATAQPAIAIETAAQPTDASPSQPAVEAIAQPIVASPAQPLVEPAALPIVETAAQPPVEAASQTVVEATAQDAVEVAATQEAQQNPAKLATNEVDSVKSFEAIEALYLMETETAAAQLNDMPNKETAPVVEEQLQAESMPAPLELPPQAEPEALETENNASIEVQQEIAAQAEEQLKLETATAASVKEEIEVPKQQTAEAPVETKPLEEMPVESEPIQVQPVEEQPVYVQPVQEQPVQVQPIEEHPVHVEPVETQPQQIPLPVESQPAVEQLDAAPNVVPPSLPPLFNKQNFNNPNEYYKQMQEQEAILEQAAKRLEERQTTPTPASHNAYEALYEEEATPAPAAPAPADIVVEELLATGSVEPVGVPAAAAVNNKEEAGPGLFTTIMDTVNSFISNQGSKEPETAPLTGHDELHRLLYPDSPLAAAVESSAEEVEGYCKRPMAGDCHATITLDNFVEVFAAKVVQHSVLLLCVGIAAASSLCFISFYYCCCNGSQEGALLAKLNHLERSLLASHKENLILKHDLMTTRTKLSSIEDNSFGSNDMVSSLKKQLETELYEKAKLQEQVTTLEKDLDNAAEAGLELNKMLSEVLNGQNGDEAFMSTVEELQRQLNDQEKIIIEINGSLAEKSRENSELQYSFTESTTRLTSEMKSLQQDNYELEMEKAKLQTRLEEMQAETEQELAKALEARNYEMQRLQHQIMESNAKLDKEHSELQTSLAKIEALEECLKLLKQQDGNLNVKELIKSAKTRGELNATQQKFVALQTKLEQEQAAKTRLESQLQSSSADVEQLKQDFNQSERDKLEAQTRLEVLSGYFREKETELQKELSLQEAKWLQHQGENASTVETQTLMKNEIQTLKSQNDELRAEIEAQIASHKAQMGTLENRAHESWLAARQSERRCEEAQAEAAGLRRKLTTMASGGAAGDMSPLEQLPLSANGSMLATDLNSNPSPLPLPLSASVSPGLLSMPNPLPFLPAPFSPFMGLPPPFLPPAAGAGGARLPPLGRMRSPPPASSSRGGDRYDDRDDRDDYSDYDDYDDEEEDERLLDHRRRHSGSWGRGGGGGGHRDDYMHSPRTYRSLSPSDSRYNYNDTETDFSPPPSPLPPAPRKSSRPLNEV